MDREWGDMVRSGRGVEVSACSISHGADDFLHVLYGRVQQLGSRLILLLSKFEDARGDFGLELGLTHGRRNAGNAVG